MTYEIGSLTLEHPVLNGSGTFDAIAARRVFGDALLEDFPFSAFVSKTITPEPRAGNPPPRLYETPSGMINSIGLPNKGIEGFLEHDLPRLAELSVPLIVSVMATDRAGFERLVDGVGEREEVAALELNVSCPNVKSGLIVGEEPSETRALVAALRDRTDKPIVVKLNTIRATAFAPGSSEPWLGAGSGGLSGPAVKVIALEQVRRVSAVVSIAVIGMGGIETASDAADFIAAGSDLVAVGTASFRDPAAAKGVRDGLEDFLGDTSTLDLNLRSN
jgi:dihydroorotate dehydrogenase (NAD+) catalytic subunit